MVCFSKENKAGDYYACYNGTQEFKIRKETRKAVLIGHAVWLSPILNFFHYIAWQISSKIGSKLW
jgi:hypothetical protein